MATITDYRTRLALYRTDSALVSAHASAPWITVWDDHEVANNGWKAGTSDSNDSVATGGCAFSPSLTCVGRPLVPSPELTCACGKVLHGPQGCRGARVP